MSEPSLPDQDAGGYPVGHTYVFDIGDAQIEHTLESLQTLRYRILTGERAGGAGTVAIQVRTLRPDLYLVSWQEADQLSVVHVEDFAAGRFEACITFPDLSFRRLRGRMWRVV